MDPLSKSILLALVGVVLGLMAKIVWDWLKNRGVDVPHAGNGFMTLSEIQDHCSRQQAGCAQVIRGEFAVMEAKLQARLDRGDKQFDVIEARIGAQGEQIAAMEATVRDLIVNCEVRQRKVGQ